MKTYSSPQLAEYGSVREMTLGSGGTKPDLAVVNGALVDTNTDCSDPSPNTTACIVVS
jgi:hypothetical protein